MGIKYDAKDRKLLEVFTDNADMPLKQLAKHVGLSRETTAYRIKRLQRTGIISSIVAKIDMTRFYSNAYAFFMRFGKVDEQYMGKAVAFFQQNPYVMWSGTLSGNYDLGVSFLTRSPEDLAVFFKGVDGMFGKNIHYDLYPYEKEYKNTYRGIFTTKQGSPEALMNAFSQKQIKLDEKDNIILYELSKNAEMTNKQLAKLTKLTPEAVRLRIQQYKKTGIIKGYRAVVDINKVGYQMYYIFMYVDNLSASEQKFQMFIENAPEVYYCSKIIGRYNVQASVWAKSPYHFQTFLRTLRNTFDISEFGSQLIFSDNQHTYFPKAAIQ